MIRIEDIANAADIVVNGYAFTKEQKYIRVLNLNNAEKATLLASDGVVLETTMDIICILLPIVLLKQCMCMLVIGK